MAQTEEYLFLTPMNSQGCRSLFLCGQAIREKLMLGGRVSGGMPPKKFSKIGALRLNLGVFQGHYII